MLRRYVAALPVSTEILLTTPSAAMPRRRTRSVVETDERRGTTQVEIAQSPLARDALAEAAARLSQLAHDARHVIEELHVNPVIVALDSAVAVDVLITPGVRGHE
ncbi:acetate--CoA ligase family protein [Defluviimonas sp. WL0050]|uniref:Acetate--CoA ligase family protein n=1 Tax=Albidovulum litorale TaxID=2984134 RepID=A0ABT2ZP83_9RHOB|nr:acetate--CoA ligase family protein [Defluviimonas sp. WL0050]MCV2872785.1 acetate--CoA ligase family protein [Defluviimonas sp. WL0050]